MTADEYLWKVLAREAVDTGPQSPSMAVARKLSLTLFGWANGTAVNVTPSGSFAKGTANKSGTDIDLFISVPQSEQLNLKEIYENLFAWMTREKYQPRRQNVSIGITVDGVSVDLVPAKRQDTYSQDHSLYKSKADTWTKTNIQTHINHVRTANRLNESRIIKLWRNQKRLEFPSFYVELAVIAALQGKQGGVAANVMEIFRYLANGFSTARIVDPANTANIISDDLTNAEKAAIKSAAAAALAAKTWGEIIT